jgi:L,D-transpeptidase ErfK/SrfK
MRRFSPFTSLFTKVRFNMSLPYRAIFKTQVIAFAFLAAFISSAFSAEFSKPDIGELRTVRTEGKETLVDVAAKYKIGYAQLIAANPGLDPWLPGTGAEVVLPEWHILPGTTRNGILLNTAELRLYYFPADGSEPATFPIGVGREGLYTPLGTTTIVSKTKDPSWRPTPRMRQEDPRLPAVVEGGTPDNPLGAFALYLGWPSYRIHGTNHEKAIGRRASSGCIRMYKPDITWMYQHINVGTKVTSIDEPIKMAWIGKDFFVEAEPNDIQIDEIEYKNRQITVDVPDGVIAKIRAKAGDKVEDIDWEKVRNVLIQRTGIPTKVMK